MDVKRRAPSSGGVRPWPTTGDERRAPDVTPTVVVHIFGAMDVGGAETRMMELMKELRADGIQFHFVALSGRRGVLAETIEAEGGRVHALPLSPTFALNFVRLLWRVRPVAVDSHVATFSGLLLLLAQCARVPVRIARFHSTGDGHGDSARRCLQRQIMRFFIGFSATHIVGVSPVALAQGYRADWSTDPRCAVVPNGVDVERLWAASDFRIRDHIGAEEGDVICLHLGRAAPEKNRARIPAVVAAMRALGLPARAVLVGPGDAEDEAAVRRSAADHGVADRIHILGARHDIGCLLRSADLLLLPSLREGLPGTVLEALAVGTPALSSTVGGSVWIAGLMSGVQCISLDEDDDEWAKAARRLVAGRRKTEAEIRALFDESPFSIKRSAQANRNIYRGVCPS